MTVILDTKVLSELRLPTPDQNVVAWLVEQAEQDLAIASFSVAEIEYGVAVAPESKPTLIAQLTAWRDAILATQRVLPLDAAAAQVLGRLTACLPRETSPPRRRTRANLRGAADVAAAQSERSGPRCVARVHKPA